MAVARVMFLAKYRVPHACFSLQWDQHILGIDKTIVASPVPRDQLWRAFDAYRIDTSRFEYVNDDIIYQLYPEVNNWVFENDYRVWWLRQQAIKLSYIDYIGEDVMLMYDPDTFMIEDYQCYYPNTDTLNFMSLLNTTQGSYNRVFECITGLNKVTPHCFVTELVPVRHTDWLALRDHLARRWPSKHWLDAIIDSVPGWPAVPPWNFQGHIKWFSEYEFVGNWAARRGNVTYQAQRRFEYDELDKLVQLDPAQYNAVCDAVTDMSRSMSMDWDTYTIHNFDRYRDMVQQALSK